MESTLSVRPGKALTAAALLVVATCSYTLGAAYGGAQQQYSVAATRNAVRTQPLVTGGSAVRHLGQAAGPVSATPLLGDATATDTTHTAQAQSWVLPMAGLGSMLLGAMLFAWNSRSRQPAHAQPSADAWRAAAVQLEEGFPGPGNPNDEFEVTVVWGGEERKLKIKGDQSILMACEEAGLHVPYLCRHGVCLECTGQILEGNEYARRDSQCHDSENVKSGYICTCSTYVGGNGMKVQMGMVEEAYKKQFGKFEEEERLREERKKSSIFG